MTRAERFLYVTHAIKRRVYGQELASEPSQFLNEMPLDLIEDLTRGNSWLSFARGSSAIDYEHGNRGSSPTVREGTSDYASDRSGYRKERKKFEGKTYDSVDSIAEFFKQRAAQLGNTGGSFQSTREREERNKSARGQARSQADQLRRSASSARNDNPSGSRGPSSPLPVTPSPGGSADFVPGSYVKHAQYGRGLVLRREGVGDSLKLTVTFPGYGQKKLIQKYAGLEKA